MKGFKYIVVLSLSLTCTLLLSACRVDVALEQGGRVFFAFSEKASSKTYLNPDCQVVWNMDDRVCIFDGSTAPVEYAFCGTEGQTSGPLSPVPGSVQAGGEELDGCFAVYPVSDSPAMSADGVISIQLPQDQPFTNEGFAQGYNPMAAVASGNKLYFKNLCGILIIKVYGSGNISSASLTGMNGEPLSGNATIRFDADGVPALQMSPGASGAITVNCNEDVSLGSAEADAVSFSFVVPPTVFTKGICITLFDAQGRKKELYTTKSVTVKRSCISYMQPREVYLRGAFEVKAGEPLPDWQEGFLDIHSINGGRGEAFYYIMPDGTTMLIDAAGAPPAEFYDYGSGNSQGVPSKPSVNASSGTVIVDYIRHFSPSASAGKIDYFMTSHYHGDHIGAWRSGYLDFGWQPYDKNGIPVATVNHSTGGFIRNGIADVGMGIVLGKVLDRGDWANRTSEDYYSSSGKLRYANYVNFLDYSSRTYGTVRETLQVGHTDQIVMLHNPSGYSNFSIRTIASGGNVWTGSGTEVNTTYMPSAAEFDANHAEWAVDENIFSNVIVLKYGNFDWFTGGDIQYTGRSAYAWKDIELPISMVVGKVEAMKACHHSTKNTNSDKLLKALTPDVYIAGVWRDVQPNPATLKRVYAANSKVKVFTTNLAESNRTTLLNEGVDPGKFEATGGHVVLRVGPGGYSFYVLVLDDSDFNYVVKSIHGPYSCK